MDLDIQATVDEYQIGEDDILVDERTGRPSANWSKLATVVNKVDVKYDFNVPGLLENAFAKEQIYSADTSVTRYAPQPTLNAEFRGVKEALGGQAVMDRFALLFLQLWGYPPPILLLSVTFRRHLFEFLDSVRITHSMIPHYEGGTLGLDHELFQVLTVNPQLLDAEGRPNGRLDLALLWIGHSESSAVPTSGGSVSFIPGESTVDATDVNVPLGSFATVTTPGPNCSGIRIGLKTTSGRIWVCGYDAFTEIFKPPSCALWGPTFDISVWNSLLTYHMEYKRSTAPDIPGSGGDPSTGWVSLLASTDQGNTAQLGLSTCLSTHPSGAITEVKWTIFFETLFDPPATWNVRPFFDSIAVAGDPCPTHTGLPACGGGSCLDQSTGSFLDVDNTNLTIDFIEGIV